MSKTDKEKGTFTRKPSMRKRLFGGMKSILPKVNRARTKSMRLDRSKLTEIGRTGSNRTPLPELPDELKALMRNEFILYLGKDFTSTLCTNDKSSTELIREVLSELRAHMKHDHFSQKSDISSLLQNKGNKSALNDIIKIYQTVFGANYFNKIFKTKLIAKFEAKKILNDSLPFKLIKSLKPLFIIYEDVDLNLEQVFKHDNLKSVTYTNEDLISLALVHENPINELLRINDQDKVQIILKLNGSISDPSSLAVSEYDSLSRFGISQTGNFLSKEVLSKDNKIMKVLLKDVLDKYQVVFVGQHFIKQTAISTLLQKVNKKSKDTADHDKEKEKEGDKDKEKETVEVEKETVIKGKNYALVKKASNQRIDGHKLNLEYIEYITPDESEYNTQHHADEFLAYLAGFASKAIPKVIPHDAIFVKSYVQALSAAGFIKGLSKKEAKAKLICIFVTDLKQIPFGDDKETVEYMTKFGKKKLDSPEHVERFLENFKFRENTFKELIYPSKTEESVVPVEEIGDKKETPEKAEAKTKTENISEVKIKLLITKRGIQQFENLSKRYGLEKVQNLIEFISDSNGKIVLKVVDSEVNDEVGKDFELLFLNDTKKNRSGTSDVCLVQQSYRKNFAINWFETNTNETEEKVMFFDRMWTTAIGQSESLNFLSKAVEKATISVKKAAEEGQVQSKTKGRSKVKSKAKTKGQKDKEKSRMQRKYSKNKVAGKSKKELKKKELKKNESKNKQVKKKEVKKAEPEKEVKKEKAKKEVKKEEAKKDVKKEEFKAKKKENKKEEPKKKVAKEETAKPKEAKKEKTKKKEKKAA